MKSLHYDESIDWPLPTKQTCVHQTAYASVAIEMSLVGFADAYWNPTSSGTRERVIHPDPATLVLHHERQIAALQREVQELRALLTAHEDERIVPLDPWQRWIETHPEEMTRHTGEHLAIHPERGIVHHEADERAFAAWYAALSDREADVYLITFGLSKV